MLGLQAWMSASVSTAAQDDSRKNSQDRRQRDKMPRMIPSGSLSDPPAGGGRSEGVFLKPMAHMRLWFNSFKGHTLA